MGDVTKIQWCDHTFNPWRGCSRVSPGCDHCYAEAMSKRNPRALGIWGDDGTRVIASESYWREPLRWNREAEMAGVRARVFCASLADVFENRPELLDARARLARVIAETPWLDWLLLTKRPENVVALWEHAWWHGVEKKLGVWPRNIWLGTTCEDQARADERIPHLLRVPAAVRFLSVEPMIGAVEMGPYLVDDLYRLGRAPRMEIDWIIVGGESGPRARPFDIAWARSIVAQCKEAGVPVFVKQLGARPLARDVYDLGHEAFRAWDAEHAGEPFPPEGVAARLRDRKGGDPAEWPEDLRVREFPRGTP